MSQTTTPQLLTYIGNLKKKKEKLLNVSNADENMFP